MKIKSLKEYITNFEFYPEIYVYLTPRTQGIKYI